MADIEIVVLKPNERSESTQALGMATATYTQSQHITYFATDLPASSNYPRHARVYVEYCLKQDFGIDAFSAARYTHGFPPNRITAIRRLLKFYTALGSPRIVLDPPPGHRCRPQPTSWSCASSGRPKPCTGSTPKAPTKKHSTPFSATSTNTPKPPRPTSRRLPCRDKAIISLLALEGLRTVEVTRLRLGDLDVARHQLLVLGKGKNTKKAIKLFAACSQVLQAYLTERDRWPIQPGCQAEFLFPDLKTHQIRYIVDKELKRHGLKRAGMSAHSLRHTVGQLLLEQGVTLEHVQQHLRHETMETTQFYTKKKTLKTYFRQMPD